ncbi:LLM class flavin-dependent oxidoreductase [Streptomyces sp. NPDC016566]|uniref:LLM class flavin-dependent oxidoreductase n=1 Tax=Streptomyces sp. NPDC016566 TaxID=3364967 RepID=UPI0036FBA5D0
MSGRYGRGLLHLAAAVDQPGSLDAASCVELAQLAERGGLDFVTLDDSFAHPGPDGRSAPEVRPGSDVRPAPEVRPGSDACPGPDALAVLSRVASATRRIGLVPAIAVATAHTEPFRVRSALASLDRAGRGRAGWRIDVSATEDEARLSGRRHAAPAALLWQEAGEVAEEVGRLWDSGEDGMRRRDPELPRPPQRRHPTLVVDATAGPARSTAARYADVALVRVADPTQAGALRRQLRDQAEEFGRNPGALRVLVSLLVDLGDGEYAAEPGHGGGGPRPTAQGPLYRGGPVDLAELIAAWHAADVTDGFHLVPVEPRRDLERLVNGTVALLQHRGLFRTFYPGSTLREHLGLDQYARNTGAQPRAHTSGCPTRRGTVGRV